MLNIPIVAFWVHFISTYTNRNTNLFLLKRLLRLFILNVQKILFPRRVHQRCRYTVENTDFVRGSLTVRLVSSLTGLDTTKEENLLFSVFCEASEFNPAKL